MSSTINGAFTIAGTEIEVMNVGVAFEAFMEDMKKSGLKIKHYRYDVNLSDETKEQVRDKNIPAAKES